MIGGALLTRAETLRRLLVVGVLAGELTLAADVASTIERFRDGGALAGVLARYAAYESRILDAPLLRAVPDLHAVARALCAQIRSTLPEVRST